MKRIFLLVFSCLVIAVQAQQWIVSRPADEGVVFVGGACNGNGNFIVGACNNNDYSYIDACAMYVNNDGETVERTFSFDGYKSHLSSAVCLDNGNAFVVGVKGGTETDYVYDTLWMLVLTPELDIVEQQNYPLIEPYKTWTTDIYLQFNNYGDIIVLADASQYSSGLGIGKGVYAVFKTDIHGNIIKSQYFAEGHGSGGARPTGLIRVPNSDNMMLLGKGFYASNSHSLCYINNDLDIVETYPLPWFEDNWNHTDCWKENGHFLMSSLTHHYGVFENSHYVAVFEVDNTGHYIDTLVYDRADTADYTAQFGSMAYVSDDIIYIATYCENGNNERPSDAVICLIDNDLNLKGIKKLKIADHKIRIKHCQKTSDGGCLVYGQCRKSFGIEVLYVWKLLPEDFIIPWTLDESTVALPNHEVYPNPTKDCLNIVLNSDNSHRYIVSVSDMNGRKYFEHRFELVGGLLTLDVSSLDNGSYFYEIFDGQCKQKGKFLKY